MQFRPYPQAVPSRSGPDGWERGWWSMYLIVAAVFSSKEGTSSYSHFFNKRGRDGPRFSWRQEESFRSSVGVCNSRTIRGGSHFQFWHTLPLWEIGSLRQFRVHMIWTWQNLRMTKFQRSGELFKRDLGHSRVPVRHFDVRLGEIIALEKKRFVSTFGKSIGTAVPDI
jgi:hypothetical protein